MGGSEMLQAKEGAEFHARVRAAGYNQVLLSTEIRRGRKKTALTEQACTDPATARDVAAQFAREAGFDTMFLGGVQVGTAARA
jgi:hypothetical protein